MGADYLIDHVIAEYNARMEEKVFRSYVSDLLMLLAEGKIAQIQYRYSELIEKPKEVDEKTGDEIALEVIARAGLKGKADEFDRAGGEAIA